MDLGIGVSREDRSVVAITGISQKVFGRRGENMTDSVSGFDRIVIEVPDVDTAAVEEAIEDGRGQIIADL